VDVPNTPESIAAEGPANDIPVPEAIRRIANSEDRRLAWHFFVFFSRMEYALKRSGKYLMPVEKAEPNWDKFGSDHDEAFRDSLSDPTQNAVDYIVANPPRYQIRQDGRMNWSEPRQRGTGPLLIWLFLCIRTVRNNLFHGGKFPLIPIGDPSRDRNLLMNALVILNASLELDQEVRNCFFDNLEDH